MLVQTTAPAEEPVTLAEARLHLKLMAGDGTVEDDLIELWISAARRHAEMYTGRSFITQGWRLILDSFPRCIVLERGDVQQIGTMTYRDMAGTAQTVTWAAPADSIQRSSDGTLVADLSGGIARIRPAFGCTWPEALPEIGAVAVPYTAGYGAAAAVPEGIKSWILLRVARMHASREEPVNGEAPPSHLDGLLDPYVVPYA